jgi:hypothetical protein
VEVNINFTVTRLLSIGVLGMILGGLIGSRIKKKIDLNKLTED